MMLQQFLMNFGQKQPVQEESVMRDETQTSMPLSPTSELMDDNDPLGMSLLTQAMQPDKIFDLPLALVRVQQAFQ